MKIRLADEEVGKIYSHLHEPLVWDELTELVIKAQLKKVANAIESMAAGGWCLEDIVKAIRGGLE